MNDEFPTFAGFATPAEDNDYAEQETLDGKYPTTEGLK